ncbi:phage tail tube protein fii [Bacillus sp. OxB-1]|uniref:phage major tail tube protein n=1 Tax=Bacillus sp. (strain OxB-1) TaxID=98228 RepID=UPI00058220DF|nr:phage major tail tube protein [Bacillus sp. OxB-1]BAQ11446.1 phage tail tube protein fii [Bacillus sp. OxB-1]
MSIIPEKLNDFRVYVNDSPERKGIGDLQLPSLDAMTETVSAAGVLGEYESPNIGHLQSMKLTINWTATIDKTMTDFYKQEAVKVDCRLADQKYDSGKHKFVANRVLVQGHVVKHDFGKAAKGSPYEGSTEIEVLYLKIESDKKVLIEYDRTNYIYMVDGVDVLAGLRTALGM